MFVSYATHARFATIEVRSSAPSSSTVPTTQASWPSTSAATGVTRTERNTRRVRRASSPSQNHAPMLPSTTGSSIAISASLPIAASRAARQHRAARLHARPLGPHLRVARELAPRGVRPAQYVDQREQLRAIAALGRLDHLLHEVVARHVDRVALADPRGALGLAEPLDRDACAITLEPARDHRPMDRRDLAVDRLGQPLRLREPAEPQRVVDLDRLHELAERGEQAVVLDDRVAAAGETELAQHREAIQRAEVAG